MGLTSLMFAGASEAAPVIASIVNAASNNLPALPDGGVAPGAIFVAYGSGLGPATLAVAPAAFQAISVGPVTV